MNTNPRNMRFSYYNRPISNTEPSRVVTLQEVHQLISGEKFMFNTKRYRVADDKVKKDLKRDIFDYATFSGIFSTRNEKNLIEHSGLLTVDLDNLPDVNAIKQKLLNDPYIETGLLFRSPSGNGIKWIVLIDLEKSTHMEWFEAISLYLNEAYSLIVDPTGKDVSRACFLCYDPDAYINPLVTTSGIEQGNMQLKKDFSPKDWLESTDNSLPSDDTDQLTRDFQVTEELHQDVDNVISAIEHSQLDITNTYKNWRDIGFALADALGESGREYYRRVSQFYPDYCDDECDKQYDRCLNSQGSGITIRSLFYHAKKSGIEIISEDINMSHTNYPVIPEQVYETLPAYFQQIVKVGRTARERDILLLGSLVTLSSSINQVYGYYGSKMVNSNLYFFLEGSPASGKSILDHCKELIMPIHKELKKKSENEMENFRKEMIRYKEQKKEDPNLKLPAQPKDKMLIFPANISAAGMYQLLNNNNGIGLFFETEGDTLANTFKQDYGNFSDGLRKAFHHEAIRLYRKTNSERIEVERPQLSVVLSGTPKQVLNLVPNAENGLFSRFIYYSLPLSLEWKDVFETTETENLDDYFAKLGNQFFEYNQQLRKMGNIEFKLSVNQQRALNRNFEQKQKQYSHLIGENFISVIRRSGLIGFRMSMILSVMRQLEQGANFNEIICQDDDFENVLSICNILIEHSAFIFSGLAQDVYVHRLENQKQKFLRMLPPEFSRQDYLAIAESIGLNTRTAEGYIKKFNENNLIHHYAQNKYKKTA